MLLPIKKGITLYIITVTLITHSLANTYYVSTTGDDTNPGTESLPWVTIQKANMTLIAGDTVLIKGGTYQIYEAIIPQNSGTANDWIVYKSFLNQPVFIDAGDRFFSHSHFTAPFYRDLGVFQLSDVSYIRIEGLTVLNSQNAGFNIRSCEYIELHNNTTINTYSSGISAWYSDQIKIINNTISGATRISDQSPHEALSLGSVYNFEVAYNEIRNSNKEGIDIKRSSKNGTVHHNEVYGMLRQGIYIDGGLYDPVGIPALDNGEPDGLIDVEVYENVVYDNAQGISVASEGGVPVEHINIHHNIAYNNFNAGIEVNGRFENDGPRSHITITNNTVFHCGQLNNPTSSGGIFVETQNVQYLLIRNNILVNNGLFQIGISDLDFSTQVIVIDYNLYVGEMIPTFESSYTTITSTTGNNAINAIPKFTDSTTFDFTLTSLSPAIDMGHPSTIYNDPDDTRNDIGAFYFDQPLISIPTNPTSVTDPISSNPTTTIGPTITSLSGKINHSLTISPNPITESKNLTLEFPIKMLRTVKFTTISGKTVYETLTLKEELHIDTNIFTPGIYLVSATSGKSTETIKLLIQ